MKYVGTLDNVRFGICPDLNGVNTYRFLRADYDVYKENNNIVLKGYIKYNNGSAEKMTCSKATLTLQQYEELKKRNEI